MDSNKSIKIEKIAIFCFFHLILKSAQGKTPGFECFVFDVTPLHCTILRDVMEVVRYLLR